MLLHWYRRQVCIYGYAGLDETLYQSFRAGNFAVCFVAMYSTDNIHRFIFA